MQISKVLRTTRKFRFIYLFLSFSVIFLSNSFHFIVFVIIIIPTPISLSLFLYLSLSLALSLTLSLARSPNFFQFLIFRGQYPKTGLDRGRLPLWRRPGLTAIWGRPTSDRTTTPPSSRPSSWSCRWRTPPPPRRARLTFRTFLTSPRPPCTRKLHGATSILSRQTWKQIIHVEIWIKMQF